MIYAVIDTNVLVSALLTSNTESATVKVVQALFHGLITPLYNEEIWDEYSEVLNRSKFHFSKREIDRYLEVMIVNGLHTHRVHSDDIFPDPKDIVFYEVTLSKDDAFLVTGNKKHFPKTPIVVSPAEMLEILLQEGIL
jgi:putative PIN family toxin of toxin-antitoxin system